MPATLQSNAIIRPHRGPDLESGFLSAVASFRPCDLSFEAAATILRERIRRGILTCIAEVDGRVAGTASLLLDVKFINHGGLAAIIEDVIVHPAFRGFGIGTRLVEAVAQAAEDMGCYKAFFLLQRRPSTLLRAAGIPFDRRANASRSAAQQGRVAQFLNPLLLEWNHCGLV